MLVELIHTETNVFRIAGSFEGVPAGSGATIAAHWNALSL